MKRHAKTSISSLSSVLLGDTPTNDDYKQLAQLYREEAQTMDEQARKARKGDMLQRTRGGRTETGKQFIRWENTRQSKSGKLYISRRLHDEVNTPLKVCIQKEDNGGFSLIPVPFESNVGFEITIASRRGALPFVYLNKEVASRFFDVEDEQRKNVHVLDGTIRVIQP